jgi:predicted signal transduction protein with EAL and GGDEF domain
MSVVPAKLNGLWQEALVMMVDDEAMLTDVIQTHLEDHGYQRFVTCNEPTEAMALVRAHRPDVLLLDLMMPKVSGFEILGAMRADPALMFLPVIVLTAASDAETKLRALEMGATEFLAKPVDASELVLRLRNTLAFKQYQDRLAYVDPVTSLANRPSFTLKLEQALQGVRERQDMLGLMHISCDHLRQTRETLGSRAADELLRLTAQRLQHLAATGASTGPETGPPAVHIEPGDVARVGDQDFAVALPALTDADSVGVLAKQILRALTQPFEIEGHAIFLNPGVGIAMAPADGDRAETLLMNADIACAKARESQHKTRFEYFSAELTERSLQRLRLGREIRMALERNEMRLHYQPKVCMRTGRITGAEALIRWQHPEHGLMLPGKFIGIAEEVGLISDISEWVMQQACTQAAKWHAQGLHDLKISINVAKPHFDEGKLCPRLQQLLQDTGLPPKWLMVELTESMLVQDAAGALEQMDELRALGVGLSIDDFGTGYSSLSYLKQFPANELKIDRSFIMDVSTHDKDRAIVQTVVTLGHSLGMEVVAEGIETVEQHRILQHAGCDVYQGFLFSKAIAPDAFEGLVRRNHKPVDSQWQVSDFTPPA